MSVSEMVKVVRIACGTLGDDTPIGLVRGAEMFPLVTESLYDLEDNARYEVYWERSGTDRPPRLPSSRGQRAHPSSQQNQQVNERQRAPLSDSDSADSFVIDDDDDGDDDDDDDEGQDDQDALDGSLDEDPKRKAKSRQGGGESKKREQHQVQSVQKKNGNSSSAGKTDDLVSLSGRDGDGKGKKMRNWENSSGEERDKRESRGKEHRRGEDEDEGEHGKGEEGKRERSSESDGKGNRKSESAGDRKGTSEGGNQRRSKDEGEDEGGQGIVVEVESTGHHHRGQRDGRSAHAAEETFTTAFEGEDRLRRGRPASGVGREPRGASSEERTTMMRVRPVSAHASSSSLHAPQSSTLGQGAGAEAMSSARAPPRPLSSGWGPGPGSPSYASAAAALGGSAAPASPRHQRPTARSPSAGSRPVSARSQQYRASSSPRSPTASASSRGGAQFGAEAAYRYPYAPDGSPRGRRGAEDIIAERLASTPSPPAMGAMEYRYAQGSSSDISGDEDGAGTRRPEKRWREVARSGDDLDGGDGHSHGDGNGDGSGHGRGRDYAYRSGHGNGPGSGRGKGHGGGGDDPHGDRDGLSDRRSDGDGEDYGHDGDGAYRGRKEHLPPNDRGAIPLSPRSGHGAARPWSAPGNYRTSSPPGGSSAGPGGYPYAGHAEGFGSASAYPGGGRSPRSPHSQYSPHSSPRHVYSSSPSQSPQHYQHQSHRYPYPADQQQQKARPSSALPFGAIVSLLRSGLSSTGKSSRGGPERPLSGGDFTFRPRINSNTQRILNRSRGGGDYVPLPERIHSLQATKVATLMYRQEESNAQWSFQPSITEKSKELARDSPSLEARTLAYAEHRAETLRRLKERHAPDFTFAPQIISRPPEGGGGGGGGAGGSGGSAGGDRVPISERQFKLVEEREKRLREKKEQYESQWSHRPTLDPKSVRLASGRAEGFEERLAIQRQAKQEKHQELLKKYAPPPAAPTIDQKSEMLARKLLQEGRRKRDFHIGMASSQAESST